MLLWLLLLLLFKLARAHVSHLYVDRKGTVELVKRWKPQLAAGQLLSITGVNNYAKAHIVLHDEDNTVGGILSEDMDLFVLSQNDKFLCVEACLWRRDDSHKTDAFRELRQWTAEYLPCLHLTANLEPGMELQCWKLSQQTY